MNRRFAPKVILSLLICAALLAPAANARAVATYNLKVGQRQTVA